MSLSPEELRQLLTEAQAVRGEACFAMADRLDAAGLPHGSYDLGDDRIRFQLPSEQLCTDVAATRLPAMGPAEPTPPPPRQPPVWEAIDAERRRAPDAAFSTRAAGEP